MLIAMEENLVGYLLRSLDPETYRHVELHLKQNAEARRQLARLRTALEPLASDTEHDEPPSGLWVRTLAHIAQDRCRHAEPGPKEGSPYRNLPSAPKLPRSEDTASGRPSWRWMDVAAMAALVLLLASFASVWMMTAWRDQAQVACQNNLRLLFDALAAYSDRHRGNFPKVHEAPPENVAGIFVPILHDDGVLMGNVSLTCPARGLSCLATPSVEDLRRMPPEEFAALAHQLGGSYAYSLGYGQPGQLWGLRSDDDQRLPILADGPLVVEGRVMPSANSPNHGGRGQNVLFVDGHVQFVTLTTVGVEGDNIYLNQQGQVAAGRSRFDSVLGASAARPFPAE
jgi:prepilin-type processing-associated H-X9-DG protein